MARYIIVRDTDHRIVNATEWDGQTPFAIPAHTLVEHETADIGGAYQDGNYTPPEAPEPVTPVTSPILYAVAQLAVDNGEISGIDVASNLSAALWLDVGLYYIFFATTQPDTRYLAKAYDDGAHCRVTEKAEDYFVVTVTDNNGDPADASELAVEIIRIS